MALEQDWEKNLPELIPTSQRQTSMGMVGHEGHERCTFELCEYSILNYTSVTQRHEGGVVSCREEQRCSTIKGLFSVDKLDEASLAGRPNAWSWMESLPSTSLSLTCLYRMSHGITIGRVEPAPPVTKLNQI
jgi:hypothetical protein